MSNEIVKIDDTQELSAIERLVMQGDLSKLSPEQRVTYYRKVCDSAGLNPYTRPLEYIILNGKMTLYARKDATEQLRKLNGISIVNLETTFVDDLYIVKATATTRDGRTDTSTGAVVIGTLKGEAKANAIMKAECVPIEYEILTKEGFKSALDLEEGEIIASMDHNTHEIGWHPLISKSIYENQQVTEFGNSAFEFEITKGHKWVTESNNGIRDLKSFDEIMSGTYLCLAGSCEDNESILTEKEAALLGWIITDGTIKSYKGELYRASICQSKKENFTLIESALEGMKFTRGVTDNRERGWMDQHWWYLSKESTQALFDKCGFKSTEDLQRIACNLGIIERKSMLESMMAADGDKRGVFGKGDINIVLCFQILCALNGTLTRKTKIREFKNSTQPFYSTGKMSYNRVARQNLIEGESRNCTVWCPTTKHGTWICRSDSGQVFVTGNTKAKRRVTLSISGMGWTDESEIDSIPGAKAIDIDLNTGEIQNGVKPLYISENQVFTIDQLINGHDDIRGKIMSFIRKGGGQALADIKAEDFDKIMRNIKAFIDQKITTISAKPEAFDDSNAPDDAEEK